MLCQGLKRILKCYWKKGLLNLVNSSSTGSLVYILDYRQMRTLVSTTCTCILIPLRLNIQPLRSRTPSSKSQAMPKTTKSTKAGVKHAKSHENPPPDPTTKQDRTTSSVWEKDGDIFIAVHAKPQSCVVDVSDSHVSVQIAAPAQEGEANSELVRALACIVCVRKSSITIDHGHRSREKRVRLIDCGKNVSEILEILKSNVGKCV